MIAHHIKLIFITLLLISVNSHAAFAPPDTYILPDLIIKQLKGNTLHFNNNISVNTDQVIESWQAIPYDILDEAVKTIECPNNSKQTSRVISCNKKYLLQLDDTSKYYEDCQIRFPTDLINRNTGQKVRLNQKLAGCTKTTSVAELDGWLWFASYWTGTHSDDYYGDGLFRINTTTGKTEFVSNMGKESQGWLPSWKDVWSDIHIYSVAADEKNNAIWFTSTLGLHHLKLDTQHLTSYFIELYVDESGEIQIGLSKTKPTHDLPLYIHLIHLKIHNRAGFAKAWHKSNLDTNQDPRMHENLIPYYLETLHYLSDSNNDMYLFNTLVHDILTFNKNKYAASLALLYSNHASLDQQARLEQYFNRFELPLKSKSNEIANRYLLDFLEGKKSYSQLCRYYGQSKYPINKVNIELLSRSGEQLSNVLNSCFSNSGWHLKDKLSQDFISTLYDRSNPQSKLAVCRFYNQQNWYEPDNQLFEKMLLDLAVFRKEHGNASHDCLNWLVKTITTDEQILFIQNVRSSDSRFNDAKSNLLWRLNRTGKFPIFKKQRDQNIKYEEDNCMRQLKTESLNEFRIRCQNVRRKLKNHSSPPSDGGWNTYEVIINRDLN